MENTVQQPKPETYQGDLMARIFATVECVLKQAPKLEEESDMEMDRR